MKCKSHVIISKLWLQITLNYGYLSASSGIYGVRQWARDKAAQRELTYDSPMVEHTTNLQFMGVYTYYFTVYGHVY